jgi:hypothetical protein
LGLGYDELGAADRAKQTSLCLASPVIPFIFQVAPVPWPGRIKHVMASATRMFLAAYQRKKD